jgi:hypothetical protein
VNALLAMLAMMNTRIPAFGLNGDTDRAMNPTWATCEAGHQQAVISRNPATDRPGTWDKTA